MSSCCGRYGCGRYGLWPIWSHPTGYTLRGLSGDIPIFDEICKRSLRFIVFTCLHHSCDLISFFAWHDVVLVIEMSMSVRYNFTVSEFLAGIVDINAVVTW